LNSPLQGKAVDWWAFGSFLYDMRTGNFCLCAYVRDCFLFVFVVGLYSVFCCWKWLCPRFTS
jgi:hypothetical protein